MGNALAPYIGNVAYFLVPYADLTNNAIDAVFLTSAVIWAIVIEATNMSIPFPIDEISLVIGILSATVGFLLSMILNKSLSISMNGIAQFETLVSNIEVFAWTLVTVSSEKETVDDIFIALKMLPNSIKHVFRKDFSYKYMLAEEKDIHVRNFVNELKEMDPTATRVIETYLFLLLKKMQQLDEKDYRLIYSKWEGIYTPYGTISSLIGYKYPVLFEYIIGTALFFYVLLLPISYVERGFQNVIVTFIILYFFIGLKSASKMLDNPFVTLPEGITIFPIATKTSKKTRQNIEKIQRYCRTHQCNSTTNVKKLKLDLDE